MTRGSPVPPLALLDRLRHSEATRGPPEFPRRAELLVAHPSCTPRRLWSTFDNKPDAEQSVE